LDGGCAAAQPTKISAQMSGVRAKVMAGILVTFGANRQ
jgi:hypothetical protein